MREGAIGQWAAPAHRRRQGAARPAGRRRDAACGSTRPTTAIYFLVPGLIVLIMTLIGAFLTALVMAREWERGTLEALFVTPVRADEILLGKDDPVLRASA